MSLQDRFTLGTNDELIAVHLKVCRLNILKLEFKSLGNSGKPMQDYMTQ